MIWCPGRFVSQTRVGITRCNHAQSAAALSREKCSAGPNLMGYGLKYYRSVREAISHLVIWLYIRYFSICTELWRVLYSYKLQIALTSLFFFNKCTTNDPLRTGHKNVVPKVQRLTLRMTLRRPFLLFQSGPGWPSSYRVKVEWKIIGL